jgi:hypothetical protein
MKKLLFIILVLTLISCSVDEQIVKSESYSKIGNNNNVNLNIPEKEMDWQYMPDGLGIRSEGTYPVFLDINNKLMLRYSCWIANQAQANPTGANDFVSKMSEDGIPSTIYYGYYDFNGMLSITAFQFGFPISQVEKQSFAVYPTDYKNGVNPSELRTYGVDTMYINGGSADLYLNRAPVNQGKNLIVVEINPDRQIFETNYDDNVSTLPVNVNGNQGVLDLSAIAENQTIPASELTAVRSRSKGKTYVDLDWHCVYHTPIYVSHYFTVKRNGVIVATNLEHSEFTDSFNGNPQSTTYTITITVKGLGESTPITVTVTR